jgi:hypothetical protein
MNMSFIHNSMMMLQRLIIVYKICIKSSTFNEFEVEYYGNLEDAIELWYHKSQDTIFLFKCY